MPRQVRLQVGRPGKRSAALLAGERLDVGVRAEVDVEGAEEREGGGADVADEGPLVAVFPGVGHQATRLPELLPALAAQVRLLPGVDQQVDLQVAAPGDDQAAHGARHAVRRNDGPPAGPPSPRGRCRGELRPREPVRVLEALCPAARSLSWAAIRSVSAWSWFSARRWTRATDVSAVSWLLQLLTAPWLQQKRTRLFVLKAFFRFQTSLAGLFAQLLLKLFGADLFRRQFPTHRSVGVGGSFLAPCDSSAARRRRLARRHALSDSVSAVGSHVGVEGRLLAEGLGAQLTPIRLLSRVHPHVNFQVPSARDSNPALQAVDR